MYVSFYRHVAIVNLSVLFIHSYKLNPVYTYIYIHESLKRKRTQDDMKRVNLTWLVI